MPAITERSTKPSLLAPTRLSHGTLDCIDIVKTRRFYEEVLGLDIIQTSSVTLMLRLGTGHAYVCVEVGQNARGMHFLNHNGLDMESREAVDRAHELLLSVKEEYGIRKVNRIIEQHGQYTFYIEDLDGNWWEILENREGEYGGLYGDDAYDITGLRGLELSRTDHVFDKTVRARVAEAHRSDPR